MKAGKKFEQEIRNSLKDLEKNNCFWFRIADHASYTKFLKDVPVRIGPQPGDFLAIMNSITCLIECKSSQSKRGYNSSYIKEHQLQANKDCIQAGANAYFLIQKNIKGDKKVYFYTADEFENLVKEKGRKILKWDDFDKNKELKKLKKNRWDLRPLFYVTSILEQIK